MLPSPALPAPPEQLVESGSVRLGHLLEVIAGALEPYPEARQALTTAIRDRLGAQPETRVLA
ncbi:MAG: hypothetical protein K7J46_03650 [Bryobacter sp.]|nr:hypothetical protein [Bryobacter sp. CoA8 C33]